MHLDSDTTKTCARCKQKTVLSCFYKNKSTKDGLNIHCKSCANYFRIKWSKENREVDTSFKKKNAAKESSKEKRRIYSKQYYIDHTEEVLTRTRCHDIAFPQKRNAITAKRRSSKIQRTPLWLTKDHFDQIEEFYILAKELQWLNKSNDPLQVDHIVPLQGKNVSGLHVPWNLQILPKSLNVKKNNKLEDAL